jgi:hypothetical protein
MLCPEKIVVSEKKEEMARQTHRNEDGMTRNRRNTG